MVKNSNKKSSSQAIKLADTPWGARASRLRLGLPLKDSSDAGWLPALEESFSILSDRSIEAAKIASQEIEASGPMDNFYSGLFGDLWAAKDASMRADSELAALAREAAGRELGDHCAKLIANKTSGDGSLPLARLMAVLSERAGRSALSGPREQRKFRLAGLSETVSVWMGSTSGPLNQGEGMDRLGREGRGDLGLALGVLTRVALEGDQGKSEALRLIEELAVRVNEERGEASERFGAQRGQRIRWAQYGESGMEAGLLCVPSAMDSKSQDALDLLPAYYWIGVLSGLDGAADRGELSLSEARDFRRSIVERVAQRSAIDSTEAGALTANLWLRLDREGLGWARRAAPRLTDGSFKEWGHLALECSAPLDLDRILFLAAEAESEASRRGAWARPAFEAAGLWPRESWELQMTSVDAMHEKGEAAFEAARAIIEAQELSEGLTATAASARRSL